MGNGGKRIMNKRITCSNCPLCNVAVGTLCEDYCSGMADFIEEIRADVIEEFTKDIDMDKPMHFTQEQKAWVKKYISINGERQRLDGAREFAEWLQRNDAFIADAEFDSYKPKLFFSSVESALAEWQKGAE